jgi:hypothetical protein
MLSILRFSRFEEASGYCGKCLKQAPVGRQAINHAPHLILTLLTAGLWAIFWIRDARRPRPWLCLECGAAVYKIMSNPFEKTKRKWSETLWNARKLGT